ncbi:hypothetical protein ACFW04_011593 [Cataglyphis niger]
MLCDAYKAKTASERRQHVERHQLCFNCLGRHKVSDCPSKRTCSFCDARHHSTLHDAYSSETVKSSLSASRAAKTSAVLLATARVRVTDKFGVLHSARALIDQGSEVSIIAESLAQRLQLARSLAATSIVGVGGQPASARGRVEFTLTPLRDGPPLRVSALVLKRLTTYHGGTRVIRKTWPHIDGIELADPDFFAADPVEILLGADVCAAILQPGFRRGGQRQPVAQQTTLGWILSGSVGSSAANRPAQSHHCCSDNDLHSLVQGFWRQEEVTVKDVPLTSDEQEAEDHFVSTHSRDADGRFVVRLPVRLPLPDLSGTKRSAARLLGHMERRFARDEQLKQLYTDFMQEYEVLGHMSPVRPASAAGPADCFLPHHGVMRKGSPCKIRVVFNGSSAVSSGASLNRHLKVGPNLLPALEDILLRWRVHRFVLASDIEKMYRQILVDPEDRSLQRILWRHDDQTTPRTYELNTVTYGLACAPFLAVRSLRQLADDEEARFPHGSAVLRRDVYVDDILTGAPTIEEAMDLQCQLIGLCTAGGFPLRKWSANDPPRPAVLDAAGEPCYSWPPLAPERGLLFFLDQIPHGGSLHETVRPLADGPPFRSTGLAGSNRHTGQGHVPVHVAARCHLGHSTGRGRCATVEHLRERPPLPEGDSRRATRACLRCERQGRAAWLCGRIRTSLRRSGLLADGRPPRRGKHLAYCSKDQGCAIEDGIAAPLGALRGFVAHEASGAPPPGSRRRRRAYPPVVRLDCRLGLDPRSPLTVDRVRRKPRRRDPDSLAGSLLAPSPREGEPR